MSEEQPSRLVECPDCLQSIECFGTHMPFHSRPRQHGYSGLCSGSNRPLPAPPPPSERPLETKKASTWLVILQCPGCSAQMACSGVVDPSELPAAFFRNVDVARAVAELRQHALSCKAAKPPESA